MKIRKIIFLLLLSFYIFGSLNLQSRGAFALPQLLDLPLAQPLPSPCPALGNGSNAIAHCEPHPPGDPHPEGDDHDHDEGDDHAHDSGEEASHDHPDNDGQHDHSQHDHSHENGNEIDREENQKPASYSGGCQLIKK